MHVSCKGRGIVELDLNSVFSNEDERSALAVVKSLDLSFNELTQINGLQPFSSLATLEVSNNKLVLLQGLPLSLVNLNVSHNELTTLDGINSLPFLQYLDASHNKLGSLAGVPRTAQLHTLRIGFNRLGSCAGIEQLSHLEQLDMENNFISAAEELTALASMSKLKTLVLRGNPVAELPQYRITCAQVVPTLISLDGHKLRQTPQKTPTSKGLAGAIAARGSQSPAASQQPQKRSASAPKTRASLTTQAGPEPSAFAPRAGGLDTMGGGGGSGYSNRLFSANNSTLLSAQPRFPSSGMMMDERDDEDERTMDGVGHSELSGLHGMSQHASMALGSMSFDAIKQRGESKRQELSESKKKLQVDVSELRRLLEEEYKMTQTLQKGKRKAETEVSDVRRVLAEELQKLGQIREQNGELRAEVETLRQRAEKFSKDYKYAHLQLKEEKRKHTEEVQRLQVAHQAALQAVRAQLAEAVDQRRSATEANRKLQEENSHLQEYIRVLEGENTRIAIALSQTENAASAANNNLSTASVPLPAIIQSDNSYPATLPAPLPPPQQIPSRTFTPQMAAASMVEQAMMAQQHHHHQQQQHQPPQQPQQPSAIQLSRLANASPPPRLAPAAAKAQDILSNPVSSGPVLPQQGRMQPQQFPEFAAPPSAAVIGGNQQQRGPGLGLGEATGGGGPSAAAIAGPSAASSATLRSDTQRALEYAVSLKKWLMQEMDQTRLANTLVSAGGGGSAPTGGDAASPSQPGTYPV